MFLVPGDHCRFSSIALNEALEDSEDAGGHHASPREGDQHHSLSNGPGIVLRQLRQSMLFAQRMQDLRAVRTLFFGLSTVVHCLDKTLATIVLL